MVDEQGAKQHSRLIREFDRTRVTVSLLRCTCSSICKVRSSPLFACFLSLMVIGLSHEQPNQDQMAI